MTLMRVDFRRLVDLNGVTTLVNMNTISEAVLFRDAVGQPWRLSLYGTDGETAPVMVMIDDDSERLIRRFNQGDRP